MSKLEVLRLCSRMSTKQIQSDIDTYIDIITKNKSHPDQVKLERLKQEAALLAEVLLRRAS